MMENDESMSLGEILDRAVFTIMIVVFCAGLFAAGSGVMYLVQHGEGRQSTWARLQKAEERIGYLETELWNRMMVDDARRSEREGRVLSRVEAGKGGDKE